MAFSPFSVIALSFLGVALSYLVGSLQYPMGSLAQPGGGFYPFAVGLFLTFSCLAFLSKSLMKAEEWESFPRGNDFRRIICIIITLFCFAIFLKFLGYIISCAFLMAIILYLFGLRRWVRIFLISVLTTAISYFLFYFLGASLPQGILFS